MKFSLFNYQTPHHTIPPLSPLLIVFILFFHPQHKGFCKASLFNLPTDEEDISVKCEIYEPEVKLIIIDFLFYFLMSFYRINEKEKLQTEKYVSALCMCS